MAFPLIQIGDEIREMTQTEYDALVASGWTEGTDEAPTPLPDSNA
jgi:hypothetical protein